MKIVRVDDKNLDIIVESEEYIDIYSCHDYTEEGKNKNLDLDVVKWKINGLERFDKVTENKFYIHAEPRLNNFVGYYDYHIIHNNLQNYLILVLHVYKIYFQLLYQIFLIH